MNKISTKAAILLFGFMSLSSISLNANEFKVPEQAELTKILQEWNSDEEYQTYVYPYILKISGSMISRTGINSAIFWPLMHYHHMIQSNSTDYLRQTPQLINSIISASGTVEEEEPALKNGTSILITQIGEQDNNDDRDLPNIQELHLDFTHLGTFKQ